MTDADHQKEPIPPGELTREKSLWALYRLSYKFPGSRFNSVAAVAAALVLVAVCFLARHRVDFLSTSLRAILSFANGFVPSVLGFLIAGFTVFVTVTKIEIFVQMSKVEYDESSESYLKYNLSAFLLAFTHYLAYLFVCVLFVLLAQPNSPVIQLVKRICDPWLIGDAPAYNVIVSVVLVLFGTWSMYLVLLLKSFVYNTYQVVTTTVRWQRLEEERKRSAAANHPS